MSLVFMRINMFEFCYFMVVVLAGSTMAGDPISVVENFKETLKRIDAEQDPMTTVTLDPGADAPQSTLFASCLAQSRMLDARFASIEIESGIEFVRYVPDPSFRFLSSWMTDDEDVSNIFECYEAAIRYDSPMFKYDGSVCKFSDSIYDTSVVPNCNGDDSDAVFIHTGATAICPLPSFYGGIHATTDTNICLLVNETPMTFDDAVNFCSDNNMMIYLNHFPSDISIDTVIPKLIEYGYDTNLYVEAKVGPTDSTYGTDGNFVDSDWVSGSAPSDTDPTFEAGYLTSNAAWKLTPTVKSNMAGALCMTTLTASTSDRR